MKALLKKHLPLNVFNAGKTAWHSLQALLEVLAVVKDLCAYRLKKGPVRVFFWLANPGSVGGTELQLQIIASQFPNCLVLVHGIIEEGRKNLFLQNLKKEKIPYLYLGARPTATQIAAKCLFWAASKRAICHFFNPTATLYAEEMKRNGFQIYYMETGMPERSA